METNAYCLLPNDCYGEILAWSDYYSLYLASLVCKTWYNLAMDPFIYYRAWDVTQVMLRNPKLEDQEYIISKLMKHPVVRQMTNVLTMQVSKKSIENNLIQNFREKSGKFLSENDMENLKSILNSVSHVKASLVRQEMIRLIKDTYEKDALLTPGFLMVLAAANRMECLCGREWASMWKPEEPDEGMVWYPIKDNIIQWLKRKDDLNLIKSILEKIPRLSKMSRSELVLSAIQNSTKEWSTSILASLPSEFIWQHAVNMCLYAVDVDDAVLLSVILEHPDFDPHYKEWDKIIMQALNQSKTNCLKLLVTHEWFQDFSLPQKELILRLCRIGDIDIFEQYLARSPGIELDSSALIEACWHGRAAVVAALLRRREIDPVINNNKPLRVACEMGHSEVVRILLGSGRKDIDPAVNGQYCFLVACEKGHVDLVSLLLDVPGIDPAAMDNHAVRIASEFGHVAVVKLLLKDKRVDPGAQNNYAFRHASRNRHTVVCKYLAEDPRVNPRILENLAMEATFRHLDLTIGKTVLNNSDVSIVPHIFQKGCTRTTGHEWHLCRSNHKHPNSVIFPANCSGCKGNMPFTANSCSVCGTILCTKCHSELN